MRRVYTCAALGAGFACVAAVLSPWTPKWFWMPWIILSFASTLLGLLYFGAIEHAWHMEQGLLLDLEEADEAGKDVEACLCPDDVGAGYLVGHYGDCPQVGTLREVNSEY